MIRLRSCYQVLGNIRFLSHLDTLKLMERSLRRASIPVEFSLGFNPHPKIAFGPARFVGLASTSEYFDVELKEYLDPELFRIRLQEKCPLGISITETREISPGTPALMAQINCAVYRVQLEAPPNCTRDDLDQRINKIFAEKNIYINRISPKGTKVLDIRPGIWYIFPNLANGQVDLEMEVGVGSGVNVKPMDLIQVMELDQANITGITRTGLYVRKPDGKKDLPF